MNKLVSGLSVPVINSNFDVRRTNAAAHAQIDRLWHTTNIYMNDRISEIGEKLVAKMPGSLKVSYTILCEITKLYRDRGAGGAGGAAAPPLFRRNLLIIE